MEKDRPMDRLVCGDVGFGKTEVAIRAAFKAVCDNKQVAVLVPTTVLAYQHYCTFRDRLKDFPCRVDYLSRARKPSDVRRILKELKDLCEGPITQEELEDCRRGLLAGMNGLEDTLGGIETWYYMEVLRGGPVQTPDDARRALLAVTREDVRDILKQFTLSVSCLLTREEGNENG